MLQAHCTFADQASSNSTLLLHLLHHIHHIACFLATCMSASKSRAIHWLPQSEYRCLSSHVYALWLFWALLPKLVVACSLLCGSSRLSPMHTTTWPAPWFRKGSFLRLWNATMQLCRSTQTWYALSWQTIGCMAA